MNVGSVSFAGTSTTFQEMVKRPQTFISTEQPAAATKISGHKKNHKGLKVAAGVVIGAAAIAAGLAAGAKFKLFDRIPQEKIAGGLNRAGKFILDNAVKAKNFITDKATTGFKWVKEHLPKIGKKVVEEAPKA